MTGLGAPVRRHQDNPHNYTSSHVPHSRTLTHARARTQTDARARVHTHKYQEKAAPTAHPLPAPRRRRRRASGGRSPLHQTPVGESPGERHKGGGGADVWG